MAAANAAAGAAAYEPQPIDGKEGGIRPGTACQDKEQRCNQGLEVKFEMYAADSS